MKLTKEQVALAASLDAEWKEIIFLEENPKGTYVEAKRIVLTLKKNKKPTK